MIHDPLYDSFYHCCAVQELINIYFNLIVLAIFWVDKYFSCIGAHIPLEWIILLQVLSNDDELTSSGGVDIGSSSLYLMNIIFIII